MINEYLIYGHPTKLALRKPDGSRYQGDLLGVLRELPLGIESAEIHCASGQIECTYKDGRIERFKDQKAVINTLNGMQLPDQSTIRVLIRRPNLRKRLSDLLSN